MPAQLTCPAAKSAEPQPAGLAIPSHVQASRLFASRPWAGTCTYHHRAAGIYMAVVVKTPRVLTTTITKPYECIGIWGCCGVYPRRWDHLVDPFVVAPCLVLTCIWSAPLMSCRQRGISGREKSNAIRCRAPAWYLASVIVQWKPSGSKRENVKHAFRRGETRGPEKQKRPCRCQLV